MIVRLVTHRRDEPRLKGPKPIRSHGWAITALAVGAGVLAALAATGASGPFSGLREHPQSADLTTRLVRAALPAAPIDASVLFPSPPVVQKVVDMYDLPPAAPPVTASRPAGVQPSPSPSSNPTHDHGDDDGHDGHGGHGG
jgi:hypothetical protein